MATSFNWIFVLLIDEDTVTIRDPVRSSTDIKSPVLEFLRPILIQYSSDIIIVDMDIDYAVSGETGSGYTGDPTVEILKFTMSLLVERSDFPDGLELITGSYKEYAPVVLDKAKTSYTLHKNLSYMPELYNLLSINYGGLTQIRNLSKAAAFVNCAKKVSAEAPPFRIVYDPIIPNGVSDRFDAAIVIEAGSELYGFIWLAVEERITRAIEDFERWG